MEQNSSILHLNEFRERKQQQGVESAQSLYQRASVFTERNANIREKVRAKHIFRELLGLQTEGLFSEKTEDAFFQWFLFDYKTIQGHTMFSLFIKENYRGLSEFELIQGAIFLSTVLELARIEHIDEEKNVLSLASGLTDDVVQASCLARDVSNFKKREYVFLRRLPIVTHDILLGNIYPADQMEKMKDMDHAFNTLKEKDSELTLRAFMKRYAYRYLYRGSSVFQSSD